MTKEFFKDRWAVEHQVPNPKLEIFTKGNENTPDITYTAEPKAGPCSTKLLEYAFSEATDSFEGAFSFAVENKEIDRDGRTVFDIIPVRSIVKIYEGDLNRPAFVGIIRRRSIGASMTSREARRSITFTGKSIISCITEYTLSLDVRIQGVADAISKSIDLTDELARDGLTIKEFMQTTWEHFREVSESAGVSTTGIADLIAKFIGDPGYFINVSGKEQVLRYNIATVFYNASNNVIADVWRDILPDPVYEIFSYCDNGKPRIMARQMPYGDPDNGNYDWKNLDRYHISPKSLVAYNLEQSDEEVYTCFASYVIGSGKDKEFYMATNQTGNDETVWHDLEKQKLYGFKPLQIDFVGYDRQGNTENQKNGELTEMLKKLNKRAAYWYSRLEEMYSGGITICTDFNNPKTNPRVGCRAKFMGGEFYINKADHTWKYGGTPTIKLAVSRGMIYDEDGRIRPGNEGVIKNLGRGRRELEEEQRT
jgi:hypothetical protein